MNGAKDNGNWDLGEALRTIETIPRGPTPLAPGLTGRRKIFHVNARVVHNLAEGNGRGRRV